jgi:hypothetical protein
MAKEKMSKKWWVVIAVVAVIILYVIFAYNSFVGLGQNINGKWSEV